MSTPIEPCVYTPQIYDENYTTWADTYFPTTDWSAGMGQDQPTSDIFQSENWEGGLQDMTFQNYGPAGGMSTSEQPMSTTMCGVVPQNDSLNFGMERMFDDIEHPTSRLEAENRRLGAILEEQNKRIQELEGQFDGFQEWTAQFSRLVNKMQLKLEGLSPLGKQFGYVMGSPSKKSKAQSRQKKPEPTASDGKRDLNTRRDSLAMLV